MRFNEKLKELRTQKGVSQSELADSIYVSRSAVAKWENGLGLPSDESVRLLTEYFGIDIEELACEKQVENEIVKKNITISGMKKTLLIISSIGVAAIIALIVCAAILTATKITQSKIHDGYVGVVGVTADIYDGEEYINLYNDYDRTQLSDVTLEVGKTYTIKLEPIHRYIQTSANTNSGSIGLDRCCGVSIPYTAIELCYNDENLDIRHISYYDNERSDDIKNDFDDRLVWYLTKKKECKLEVIKIKLYNNSNVCHLVIPSAKEKTEAFTRGNKS